MSLTPEQAQILSNADLEYLYLQTVTGLSPSLYSLSDMRKALYIPDERTYWAVQSGLSSGSLRDHKYAAMKAGGGGTGSLSDVARAYWMKTVIVYWQLDATNKHIWPIPTLSLWSSNAGTGGTATPTVSNIGPGGTPVFSLTQTVAATGGTPRIHTYSSGSPVSGVTGGVALPISLDVSSNGSFLVKVFIDWYNAGGGYISSSNSTAQAVSNDPAAPTRLTLAPVAPSTAVRCNIFCGYSVGTDAVVGAAIRVSRPLVGVTGTYFDGNTVGDAVTRYSWTGPVNGSTSIREVYR